MRLSALFVVLLAPAVASAQTQLSVESLAANGQQVRDISCTLAEGGMFAMVGVVAALAQQKPALDACAPEDAAFKVKWTWSAKPTDAVVERASLARAKSCVAKALKATQGPTAGTCTGLLLTGPVEAAEKAAEPMRAKSTQSAPEAAGRKVVPSLSGTKDGETVTVEGQVSKSPWQHMIDTVAGKPAEYLDLAGGDQIVVYVAGKLPEGKRLVLTGKVKDLKGTSKRPGSKELVLERQLDVESWSAAR
ncbi:MAG TPA: hypothetical protein VGK67_20535 [Myxococcales bacterium]|jgi:hypothetical protein